MNFTKKEKGFTLIELLVVISIISLLSSVVLGSLNEARNNAKLVSAIQFDRHILRTIGDSLVGSWNFDECSGTDVNDSSGYKNHGTMGDGAAWSPDSPYSKYVASSCSMQTNRETTDYTKVDIKSGDYNELTITGWFKLDSSVNTSNWHTLFFPRNSNTTNYVILSPNNSDFIQIRVKNSNGHTIHLAYDLGIDDGRWHHYAFTYNGSQFKFFLDGVERGTYNRTGSISLDWGLIGQYNITGSYTSAGKITHVKVYGKAMDVF